MTKFCLEQNTNAWFEMDGGGQIHLQTLSSDDVKEIRKKTVKKQVEYKRVEGKAERFEYEDINRDLQNELIWDTMIVEWKDIFDSRGVPIECTTANKIMMITTCEKFLNFFTESSETLRESYKKRIEEEEKN